MIAPSETFKFDGKKVAFDATAATWRMKRNMKDAAPVFDHRATARVCASHLV
jgi:hypothetical protein